MTELPRWTSDDTLAAGWSKMSFGAPTIMALARLCSEAFVSATSADDLSPEAQAILYSARDRGVFELKAVKEAFDSVERFLAVYVETDPHEFIVFKVSGQPSQTVRFLEGFRDLCASGLVLHHLNAEFSLSSQGFEKAKAIAAEEVAEMIALAITEDS